MKVEKRHRPARRAGGNHKEDFWIVYKTLML